MYAVWYGGKTPAEDRNNYVIMAMSHDNGQTWSEEILSIDPDGEGPVRAFDPQVWLAPDGRLWLFWAQGLDKPSIIGPCGVWAMHCPETEAAKGAWSAPHRICDGVMMGKPLVLQSGVWALPVSFWGRRESGSAALVCSRDNGKSWKEKGSVDVPPEIRCFDEHMVVELKDRTLWMLVRTRRGIGESFSNDGGRTWSSLQPSGIPHVASRFFIRRLASGRLLLVRHDPSCAAFANARSEGIRSHLTAMLSDDDGVTWPYSLLLDERTWVSYPDGDQTVDGRIHLIWDFERYKAQEIVVASLSEKDIQKDIRPIIRIISRAAQPSGYPDQC